MRRTTSLVLGVLLVAVGFAACAEDRLPQGGVPSSSSTAASGGDGGEPTATSSMVSTQASTVASSSSSGEGGGGGVAGAGGTGGSSCMLNMMLDGDETDVDCGGSCPACDIGKMCMLGSDCVELSCVNNMCAAPTCTDLVNNGAETGTDCGGPNCGKCPPGQGCATDVDCDSAVCIGMLCQAPTCNDATKNGTETDVDCGGMVCPNPCLVGKTCNVNTDCVTNVCSVQHICDCAPEMEIAPVPGGGAYCIDKTEVTYAQYEIFWQNNPVPSGQIPECQWNTDYTPIGNWPAPLSKKHHPVTNVNWCEAYAYCNTVGKRLCGKIGGGPNLFTDHDDEYMSEWFNACSAGGVNTYPYGISYSTNACNGFDLMVNATVAVQSQNGQPLTTLPCFGGAPDLWQMSGNVREWENSCDGTTGSGDNCRTRGGSYLSAALDLACAAPAQAPRNLTANDLGFRCCF